MKFKHSDIEDSIVTFRKTDQGTWVSDTLVVYPRIQMDPNAPDYDQSKAEALETEVVAYAKDRGSVYTSIVFADKV